MGAHTKRTRGSVSGCPYCGGAGCEECGGTGSRVITPLTVDGNVVMVHGNRLLDEADRAALVEVYRAALEKMVQPPDSGSAALDGER